MVTVNLPDIEATERLGGALAGALLPGPAVIVLEGTLGAGKSTFVRGFLRALGVTGPVASPTYGLVHSYAVREGGVHHADVYRVETLHELEQTGMLDELSQGVWLIEWGSRFASEWPSDHLEVHIDVSGAVRVARIVATGPKHSALLEASCRSLS
jgi:tRNA threonylcarbamoyladenosine biosynthesis protein TsaE